MKGYDTRQSVRVIRKTPHLSIDNHPASFTWLIRDGESTRHARDHGAGGPARRLLTASAKAGRRRYHLFYPGQGAYVAKDIHLANWIFMMGG